MKKNIFKWVGMCIISTLFLCLVVYAQTDTSMHTKGTHKSSIKTSKTMSGKKDSTSVMRKKSTITDTSKTSKKKKMSTSTGMLNHSDNESGFISGMTRSLNRRVKLNSDQVDKVHQFLTDYFTVARSEISNVNSTTGSIVTGNKEGIYVNTHNPVDTSSYVSPYASLNHTGRAPSSPGTISSTGSDTSTMYNQRAGAKSNSGINSTNQNSSTGMVKNPGNDSTNQNNSTGMVRNPDSTNQNNSTGMVRNSGSESTSPKNSAAAMENNTRTDNTSTVPNMNSSSMRNEEKSTELDQAGIKLEKQIESILTDNQRTKFDSFKDAYIDQVRQHALTIKSE